MFMHRAVGNHRNAADGDVPPDSIEQWCSSAERARHRPQELLTRSLYRRNLELEQPYRSGSSCLRRCTCCGFLLVMLLLVGSLSYCYPYWKLFAPSRSGSFTEEMLLRAPPPEEPTWWGWVQQRLTGRSASRGFEGREAVELFRTVCRPLHLLSAPPTPFFSPSEAMQQAKVLERFHAVPDHRDGEPVRRTAEVRFVSPVARLQQPHLLLFLLSAHIAGTPFELLGLNSSELHRNPMTKFLLLEAYLDETGLTDSDVIVMTDADVVFTGRDFMPMIRSFLSTTPRSPSEMDAKKIRARQLRAPLLLGTEERCSMPAVFLDAECPNVFQAIDRLQMRWCAAHNRTGDANRSKLWRCEGNEEYQRNKWVHPAPRTIVARVWALKVLLEALKEFVAYRPLMNSTISVTEQVWTDADSALSALAAELWRWESYSGVLRNDTRLEEVQATAAYRAACRRKIREQQPQGGRPDEQPRGEGGGGWWGTLPAAWRMNVGLLNGDFTENETAADTRKGVTDRVPWLQKMVIAMTEDATRTEREEASGGGISAVSCWNETDLPLHVQAREELSLPFQFLFPGLLGIDEEQLVVWSPTPDAALVVRVESGEQVDDPQQQFFEAQRITRLSLPVVESYVRSFTTVAPSHSKDKVRRYLVREDRLLQRSPTGVPLAPLNITADLRSNENQYYQNWSLDGSEGAIDLSVPYPSGVPLGLRHRPEDAASADGLRIDVTYLIPWFALLYAEGPGVFDPSQDPITGGKSELVGPAVVGRPPSPAPLRDPLRQPQLNSILKVLLHAPAIRVWERSAASGMEFVRSASKRLVQRNISFQSVCSAELQQRHEGKR